MLVQCLPWRALLGKIGRLKAAGRASAEVDVAEVVDRVLARDIFGNAEVLRGAHVALHRFAFSDRLVHFAAHVHALVGEQVQALELLPVGMLWVVEVGHDGAAPRVLADDLASLWTGMTGAHRFAIEERVEDGIAVHLGAMELGLLRGLGRKQWDGRPHP